VLNHYNILPYITNTILVTPAQITVLEKLYCSDSAVLQSLSRRMHQTFVAVGSLYNVLSPKLSDNSVRELIWNSFAMSVDL